MTDPAEFILSRLEFEGDFSRADAERERLGLDLMFVGASVGAIRGTVRDALLKFGGPGGGLGGGLDHDEVVSLASELWSTSVFEARLAAIVLLQSRVADLDNGDLTRLEGFVRSGQHPVLVDPLVRDVIAPLVGALDGTRRAKADAALARWAREPDAAVRRAALLVTHTLA